MLNRYFSKSSVVLWGNEEILNSTFFMVKLSPYKYRGLIRVNTAVSSLFLWYSLFVQNRHKHDLLMQKALDSLVNMWHPRWQYLGSWARVVVLTCKPFLNHLDGRLTPKSPPHSPENPTHPVHVTPPHTEWEKLENLVRISWAYFAALRGWLRCIKECDLMRSSETSVWRSWTSRKEQPSALFFSPNRIISNLSKQYFVNIKAENTSCLLQATFSTEF